MTGSRGKEVTGVKKERKGAAAPNHPWFQTVQAILENLRKANQTRDFQKYVIPFAVWIYDKAKAAGDKNLAPGIARSYSASNIPGEVIDIKHMEERKKAQMAARQAKKNAEKAKKGRAVQPLPPVY